MKIDKPTLYLSWTISLFVGIGIGILCAIAWYELIPAPDSPVETIIEVKVPMSIRELQTFLRDAGHSRYACKVDGKMGKETLQAWDNYICDRYAKKEFEL